MIDHSYMVICDISFIHKNLEFKNNKKNTRYMMITINKKKNVTDISILM